MAAGKLETFKATLEDIAIEVTSEPYAMYTYRGYAPVVNIKEQGGEEKVLYISPRSLAQGIELLRQRNSDKFTGIKLKIRRESDDKFAKYLVEGIFE